MAEESHIHEVYTNANPNSGNSVGVLMVIVMLALIAFLFLFGLSVFNRFGGGTQVNIPDKIDVNLKQK